jgi:hypothetical protein
VEDTTAITWDKEGDRPFRWGVDCVCGKRRWYDRQAAKELTAAAKLLSAADYDPVVMKAYEDELNRRLDVTKKAFMALQVSVRRVGMARSNPQVVAESLSLAGGNWYELDKSLGRLKYEIDTAEDYAVRALRGEG